MHSFCSCLFVLCFHQNKKQKNKTTQQHWALGMDAVSMHHKAMTYGVFTSFNETDNVMQYGETTETESIFGWSGDDKDIRDWIQIIEPELEEFIEDEYVSCSGSYIVPRSSDKLHLSADRPMANSVGGSFSQLHENSLLFQDGVKRHVLTAPYQSRPRFSFRQFWERRDLSKEYEKTFEEIKRQLIEAGELKSGATLPQIEEAFKRHGYGDDWRNWEWFRTSKDPLFRKDGKLMDTDIQPCGFHTLWRQCLRCQSTSIPLIDRVIRAYKELRDKLEAMGVMDKFKIYKSCQKYMNIFHRYGS